MKLKTYTSLKSAVRRTIQQGKERAIRAVEREKVRTCWQVGKLILKHILLNKDRARYGSYVIERLSKDIQLSRSEINKMVEFVEAYPIRVPGRELSWSHYKALLTVNNSEKRDALALRAEKNNWSRRELRAAIKKIKTGKAKSRKLKPAKPGRLDVFRKSAAGGVTLIDLGFSTYLEMKHAKKLTFVKDRNFTYCVQVDRIVDGDTFWCYVDLGLGVKTYQKIRLRGLDAPELRSRAGQAAKQFLTRQFKKSSDVIIKTTRSDKYDRYLADVWVEAVYLNQALIENDLANSI